MTNNEIVPKELLTIKLCWLKKTADTSGLSKSPTLIIGQHCILTASIDVADGLADGNIEKLIHFDRNDNDVMVYGCYFQNVKKKLGLKLEVQHDRLWSSITLILTLFQFSEETQQFILIDKWQGRLKEIIFQLLQLIVW